MESLEHAKKIHDMILKLLEKRVWGKVEISLEAGKIVNIKETRNKKITEI